MTTAEFLDAARREAEQKCTCPDPPAFDLMLSILHHQRGCEYRNERAARDDRLGELMRERYGPVRP